MTLFSKNRHASDSHFQSTATPVSLISDPILTPGPVLDIGDVDFSNLGAEDVDSILRDTDPFFFSSVDHQKESSPRLPEMTSNSTDTDPNRPSGFLLRWEH